MDCCTIANTCMISFVASLSALVMAAVAIIQNKIKK